MRQISSPDNALLKQIARLQHKPTAYRDEGVVLLEGEHLISECLMAGHAVDLKHIVLSDAQLVNNHPPSWLTQHLAQWADLQTLDIVCVPQKLLSSLASGVHHSHVFALVVLKPLTPPSLSASTVVLNAVQDAGNVGTILRTAAAAGFEQMLLDKGCAAAWSPKVLRAAMGAHSHISIYELADINNWLSLVSITSIATDVQAKNMIYDADVRMPCAWLFGSEGQGVDKALLKLCKRCVKIPQANIESLNVASAAAVCLYESVRQSR